MTLTQRQEEIESSLRLHVGNIMRCLTEEEIGPDFDLESELESLDYFDLVMRVEDQYGIKLEDMDQFQQRKRSKQPYTLRNMSSYISEKLAANSRL